MQAASILPCLIAKENLSFAQSRALFEAIISTALSDTQIAAILVALASKGEVQEEIHGAVSVLLSKTAHMAAPPGTIDTCGTGGDHHGTYNISTAVAFVVAACGVPVAKHGNRASSSKAGSADVLEALGIQLDAPHDTVQQCLQDIGIGFFFAPKHHSAMKSVAHIRKELGIKTIFNLLGPLLNPTQCAYQLLGVYDRKWLPIMANVLHALGRQRAWVVCSAEGLDEMSISSDTYIVRLEEGRVGAEEKIGLQDLGMPYTPLTALKGGDAHTNAAALMGVLNGDDTPYRDVVVLNAAAALVIAEASENLKEGIHMAQQAIDAGAALSKLEDLKRATQASISG